MKKEAKMSVKNYMKGNQELKEAAVLLLMKLRLMMKLKKMRMMMMIGRK